MSSGASPTHFIPWRNEITLDDKLNQLLQWIDLPLEKRPQLMLAYEPSLDQAGHKTGPNSALVNVSHIRVRGFPYAAEIFLSTRLARSIDLLTICTMPWKTET
jgi:predicted AlkP superfamily pyrophosphatase or phosphodiesterase